MQANTNSLPPLTVLGLDVGFFDNAPSSLRAKDEEVLRETDILAGFPKTLKAFLTSFPAYASLPTLSLSLPIESAIASLTAMRQERKKITVLTDGDPLFFGFGSTLTRFFTREELRIIPALTALQLACARLVLPLEEVLPLSLHGRTDTRALEQALADGKTIGLYLDAQHSPAWLADLLEHNGLAHYRMHLFSALGSPNERYTLWQEGESGLPGPLTAILEPSAHTSHPFGLDDAHFTDTYCTRLPIRSLALALLQLSKGSTLWDIGAGSGSLSLDACSLLRSGVVFAIEREKQKATALLERKKSFQATAMQIVFGEAPNCLASLPDPNRIFIGGGLSEAKGKSILAECANRLTTDGIVVANCVLLQSLELCRAFFTKESWHTEIHEIQAAKTKELGNDVHFCASNPVFLFLARKKDMMKDTCA